VTFFSAAATWPATNQADLAHWAVITRMAFQCVFATYNMLTARHVMR
jgi:hypothetical protein